MTGKCFDSSTVVPSLPECCPGCAPQKEQAQGKARLPALEVGNLPSRWQLMNAVCTMPCKALAESSLQLHGACINCPVTSLLRGRPESAGCMPDIGCCLHGCSQQLSMPLLSHVYRAKPSQGAEVQPGPRHDLRRSVSERATAALSIDGFQRPFSLPQVGLGRRAAHGL